MINKNTGEEKSSPFSAEGAAGLYIHVPFCPKICPYCDFAVLKAPERLHQEWLELILLEIQQKQSLFEGFRTLYFGGGTPSLLNENCLIELFDFLRTILDFSQLEEISFEANPETLTPAKLSLYESLGIRRMTLGVQSFKDQNLTWLGRNHGSETLYRVKEMLKETSLSLGLDLMFGFEGQTWDDLKTDLDEAFAFGVEHISLYGLNIEEGTLFWQKEKKGETLVQENAYNDLFLQALEYLAGAGFEQYELSNFAKNGAYAKHNQAYWQHKPYLGVGPGAHSLRGRERFWNSKNWNTWKAEVLSSQQTPSELLDDREWANEWIWLQLRQKKGMHISCLTETQIQKCYDWQSRGDLHLRDGYWVIQSQALFKMDEIASDLFV